MGIKKITDFVSKTTPVDNDIVLVVDSEDSDRYKQVLKINLASGGDYPVGERTVIVDASATLVPDKVFNTWGDADTYLTGMTPALATDNRWTIIMNGTISENVTIRNYVNIQGNSNNTTIQQIRGANTVFENTLINGCVIKDIYHERAPIADFKLINCAIDCSSITTLAFAKMKFISCTFLNFNIPDIAYTLQNAVYLYECHIVDDGTINFPAHEGIDSIFSANGCNFKNLMGGSIIFNGGEFYGCELPSINLTAAHIRFDQPLLSTYKLHGCGVGMWTLTDANTYNITLAQSYGYGEVQINNGGGTGTGTAYVYDVTGISLAETELTVNYYHKDILRTRSGVLTNPPTALELGTLLGADVDRGATAIVEDTVTGNFYFCTSWGYDWHYTRLDGAFIPTGIQGDILYHNGTDWTSLTAGTAGQYLQTAGASANPLWAGVSIASGLETITEGANTGWAFVGDDRATKGDIGNKAVDLSTNVGASAVKGATGEYSIVMGYQTTASAYGTTAGGYGSNATQLYSVAMGNHCDATAVASIAFGNDTTASGNNSFSEGNQTHAAGVSSHAEGSETWAAANASHAEGSDSRARYYAFHASASDSKTLSGDKQYERGVIHARTPDATPTILYAGGSLANAIILPADSAFAFTAKIAVKVEDSTNCAFYRLEGMIYRDSASNTTLGAVSAPVTIYEAAGLSGITVTAQANDTIESLEILVTGLAATNINWVCKLELIEIVI